ncbi:hypothetical protein LTR10_004360 [Elasticomyces elasticus]|nr:hypothetical protein LTR10_004360 [Elasticomyces elasticus]KAK4976679.1 hypothetical protein LTR42_002722 [Elasticomyces elasticus]
MEPTASECVAHWLIKLPAELRNDIYHLTFNLLVRDLKQRALTGQYSIEAGSTNAVGFRTLDALSAAYKPSTPETGVLEPYTDSTVATLAALTIKAMTRMAPAQQSATSGTALGLNNEARSIWLAEYVPYVRRLLFRFSSLTDYLTYHLPYVFRNPSTTGIAQIMLEFPNGHAPRLRSFCRHVFTTQSAHQGGARLCEICELLDLVAYGCDVLQHEGRMGDDYCPPKVAESMWWWPNFGLYWAYKSSTGDMPKSREFMIRGRKFILDHMAWNENGHTDRVRITGPLHTLGWQRYWHRREHFSGSYSAPYGPRAPGRIGG